MRVKIKRAKPSNKEPKICAVADVDADSKEASVNIDGTEYIITIENDGSDSD